MTTKQASCEERIDEHLQSYINDAHIILADMGDLYPEERAYALRDLCDYLMDNGYDAEDLGGMSEDDLKDMARRAFDESVLGRWFQYTVYIVQFSWGGPSDEFEVYVDRDGEVVKALYRFKDWFDGAKRDVHDDDLLALLEDQVRWMIDCQ